MQTSKIFDQTAFDRLASIFHFLEDFTDNNVSGIDVIAANNTSDITIVDIQNMRHINSAHLIDNSTHI
jgi:hypothetical protein